MHMMIFFLFLKAGITIKVRKFTKFDLIFFFFFKSENVNRLRKLTKLAFLFLQQGKFQGKKKKEGNHKQEILFII